MKHKIMKSTVITAFLYFVFSLFMGAVFFPSLIDEYDQGHILLSDTHVFLMRISVGWFVLAGGAFCCLIVLKDIIGNRKLILLANLISLALLVYLTCQAFYPIVFSPLGGTYSVQPK